MSPFAVDGPRNIFRCEERDSQLLLPSFPRAGRARQVFISTSFGEWDELYVARANVLTPESFEVFLLHPFEEMHLALCCRTDGTVNYNGHTHQYHMTEFPVLQNVRLICEEKRQEIQNFIRRYNQSLPQS